MQLSTVLIALAIAAVWLPNLRLVSFGALPPALPVLGIAVVAGLIDETVNWQGATAVFALVALAFGLPRITDRPLAKAWLSAVGVVLAFAVGSGLTPGFSDVVLISGIHASSDAPEVRLTARFNVAATGLVLLLTYCHRSRNIAEIINSICSVLPITLLTTFVVLVVGCLTGFVRPDIKLPSFTAIYLFKTVFWTCVLEEGFFRGVIQERLASSKFVTQRPRMWWLPIAVSSILFGFAHMRGGWTYVALATLAGIGYGMAYSKTQKIESAMFAHFVLNTVHFIGFTYPYLEGNQ